YGRGGLRPTVTDADLVCGYLNPDYFLGGAQKLDVAAARATLKAHVADPLQMDVTAAAAGIQRIVDMRMADDVRVFAAKRGVDLSAFTLLPFGGAGAVHAAAVAEELSMRRILVPPRPGAFSALGLLCTDVVHDYIRSELRTLADVTADHAEDIFRQLEGPARAELAAEGMNAADARFARELDLRYTGQGYELRTPLEGLFEDGLTAAALRAARDKFDERHAQIHGHAAKERPVEVVSYRLRVRVAVPKYEPRAAPPLPADDAVKGQRTISLSGTTMQATLYERARLDVGATVAGAAIVEQFDATTLIPPPPPPPRGRAARGSRNRDPAESRSMRPLPTQILRNKGASLVDEMPYHFSRSGYSTIIRESRDFSCVILARGGRLIVPPPMFF